MAKTELGKRLTRVINAMESLVTGLAKGTSELNKAVQALKELKDKQEE